MTARRGLCRSARSRRRYCCCLLGNVLSGRLASLLSLADVLARQSKLYTTLTSDALNDTQSGIRTHTMRARALSVALGAQLIALIAGTADAAPHRARGRRAS
jgi:hypothetical protein